MAEEADMGQVLIQIVADAKHIYRRIPSPEAYGLQKELTLWSGKRSVYASKKSVGPIHPL